LLTTLKLTRLTKILLLTVLALHLTLIAINNIIDYQTNFAFVQHVLSMDTTQRHAALMWRAINIPLVHHAFYILIIVWESAAAVICWVGAYRVLCAKSAGAAEFNEAKNVAVCGLLVGLMLWFFAFLTIGGEWFAMWQSVAWNGQGAALRLFTVTALTLLLFIQPERDDHDA
jgi:predicted small integral membrane protein